MNAPLLLQAPKPRCLETHGPTGSTSVNHFPGHFLPTMTFEEFSALPESKKHNSRPPWEIDMDSARRCIGLIDTFRTDNPRVAKAIRELRYRLQLLHPGCTDV
jgi:hypothetical protein